MNKRVIMAAVIAIALIAIVLFIYRYQILQYSAESFIRKNLPDYIEIDRMAFNFKEGKIAMEGLRVIAPTGFSNHYLVNIRKITANYVMNGKTVLNGVKVQQPVIHEILINIERRSDGKTNFAQMAEDLEKRKRPEEKRRVEEGQEGSGGANTAGAPKTSDILKLPDKFVFKDGKIIFVDSFNLDKPHTITFENIIGDLYLRLDPSYTKILSLSSTGEGSFNGKSDESIKWTVSLDPTTPRLTMSNRFEVSNVSLLSLEPYYDRYSPFIFQSGRFSGTLVFDFDNGNIGSTDEIRLSDIQFLVKQGYENAEFWGTTVPDLVKYFTTPRGDIVFDFKIKGDVAKPQFYLGPISKQALTAMAVDKISSAIQQMSDGKTPSAASKKGDIEKAKDYIDLFKNMMKK